MPTSRPNHLADLALAVVADSPADILDVGCGFGGKGVLFREYTDIWHQRYEKLDWRVRIDAIEPHLPYVTLLHHYIYDRVYAMLLQDFLRLRLPGYDFIYMGDVIEHMSQTDGEEAIEALSAICDKTLYISTPVMMHPQGAVLGNKYEEHRTQWVPEMFLAANMAKKGEWSFSEYGNVLVARWRVL